MKVRTNCNSPQQILKEIDEDFTDDEIDEVIAEVRHEKTAGKYITLIAQLDFQIDIDKSTTIDFNEFVKIMTF